MTLLLVSDIITPSPPTPNQRPRCALGDSPEDDDLETEVLVAQVLLLTSVPFAYLLPLASWCTCNPLQAAYGPVYATQPRAPPKRPTTKPSAAMLVRAHVNFQLAEGPARIPDRIHTRTYRTQYSLGFTQEVAEATKVLLTGIATRAAVVQACTRSPLCSQCMVCTLNTASVTSRAGSQPGYSFRCTEDHLPPACWI